MSSPTMEICNHFVGEDIILPFKLASDCMRADMESAPTMWLDVVGTKCKVDKCLRIVEDTGPYNQNWCKDAGGATPPLRLSSTFDCQ